jgi:Tol biopolymer transport system component
MVVRSIRRAEQRVVLVVTVVATLGAAPVRAQVDPPAIAERPAIANGSLVLQRVDWVDIIDGSGLTMIRSDGGALRKIAPHDYENPDWSPDGSKLAVNKLGPSPGGTGPMPGRDIWLLGPDGGNATRLTSDPAFNDSEPKWSPNGTMIAFNRATVSGEGSDIWMMAADGTEIGAVTTTTDRWERLVGWSPDSTKLLFESTSEHATTMTQRIEVIDTDGGDRVTLFEHVGEPLEGWRQSPAWSPDGSRIAFCRLRGVVARTAGGPAEVGTTDIWVMNANGTGQVNLTNTATPSECRPQWSPDGSLIAYDSDGDVWVMGADGAGKSNLTNTAYPAAEGGHVWSPDGSQIAYSRNDVPEEESGDSGYTSIWVMNADGSSQRKLTSGDFWDYAVSWQPIPISGIAMVDGGLWHFPKASFYYGDPGDYPMLGDWDCDGVETPGLHRQSDGYVYLRNSNSQGIADLRFYFGDPGDIPLAGDFDGDGCDTVSLYRPSEGKVYLHNALASNDQGLGAAEVSYHFGNPADKPFAGDFDGDGIDTIGLHRESTGEVYFRNSHTAGVADSQFVYGDPSDRLLCHDWSGTGSDSVAAFRPTDSRLYFRFSNTQGVADATLQWGESDWWPVAGKW